VHNYPSSTYLINESFVAFILWCNRLVDEQKKRKAVELQLAQKEQQIAADAQLRKLS
jgi:hypothetical protein